MQETIKTFRKIVIIDLILGMFMGIFAIIFFRDYIISFFIGLLMTIISFSINTFSINYSFNKKEKFHQGMSIISLFLRTILVCAVGLLMVKQNIYYIFPYILGYTCNCISLVIYSFLI